MKEDKNFDLSIITVCYNSKKTIEKTIKSIVSQTHTNFEYIIVDGGSNDGTLDIIEKYKDHVDVLLSEPDNGIYDAFNKGVRLANGDFVGILNSDDTYNPNTLELVHKTTALNPNSIVYGDTYFIDDDDVVFSNNEGSYNPQSLKSGIGFMHPASFVPKKVYDNVGLYSEEKELNIASDADFLLKCHKAGVSFVKGSFKVFMRTGGLSETSFSKAHSQYLKSLLHHGLISPKEHRVQQMKLTFIGVLKRFLTRKAVAKIKLQLWVILIALFNFFHNHLLFNFLKRPFAKAFGFKIGKKSNIHNSTFLSLGKFSMGSFSVINPKCVLDNRGGIIIGDSVSIGHYSKIYTTGHDVDCSYFTGLRKPVVIDDHVVLFSSCIIQPGVTLGKGAVVFPGAVVTKDVPPFSLVGGNPANVIGKRNENLNYKLEYGFKFIK